MTYEEALRWTDDSLSQGKVLPEQERYAYMGVVKIALEKQTPKKPIKDGYFRLCPHCETEEIEFEIEDSLEYEKFDFCPRCGQALDWSDTK